MAFPREYWPKVASTNPLERVNKEIKRRTDVVSIFPDRSGALRLVGGAARTTRQVGSGRRYIGAESLARIGRPASEKVVVAALLAPVK